MSSTNDSGRFDNDTSEALTLHDDPFVHVRLLKCANVAKEFNLTQREQDILWYLSKGRSARYIAEELHVGEQTVRTHTNHIYNKLGIHKRQQLIDLVENTPKF